MVNIEPGQIVRYLAPNEAVIINKVQKFGDKYSLTYTGVNSKKLSSKIISKETLNQLQIISSAGSFNFKGNPVKFALFAEAERIHSAYQFDPLFAVNCSLVDPLPHQIEAVYKYLLPQPYIRFLLADDTGAGKTIMAGLLIKELLMRGIVERILIVTPGGLTKQWQEDEMGLKFNIPFTLVNRSAFISDPGIFQNTKQIITSIDFISRDDILSVVSNLHWDLIIFDEGHKLSAYDYGRKQYLSKRYKAAEILSEQCEHLLLLTATPHRGRKDTFQKLLQLLDKDIFSTHDVAMKRIKEVEKNGINKFFIRRLKEDMRDWDGKPLYKKRFTRTVSYALTWEEKELYDLVTNYLTTRKEQAHRQNNIHVSLALSVMQRRLASSIYAIMNTLERRWRALQSIVDELRENPNLWNQKLKIEDDLSQIDDIADYDDLSDEEREALDQILSDPRKYKLFTTAKSPGEIQEEATEVHELYEKARELYLRDQEEKKYKELQKLLRSEGVLEHNEKLVIFTEHKDTLIYLEKRLSGHGGYGVATIHGGKNVDERREAQVKFAQPETQILIATDAAGEGINLQFCRLLINWDIPWNPNRLEQRMGRIHRYGQLHDVLVFNMVASNTREGNVLEKLLVKLDVIRESMGNDRVYDVIQDVLENVKMDDIIAAIFEGKENDYTFTIDQLNQEKIKEKIAIQKERLAFSQINYKEARGLKESSDEKRLQPVYIKMFFEKAFKTLGGSFVEYSPSVFKIEKLPDCIFERLRKKHSIYTSHPDQVLLCFDKDIFLKYKNISPQGSIHYINPGNVLFDTMIDIVREQYREEMLKGTVLITPDEKEDYFAYFVKSQILDNKESLQEDSIADEKLFIVKQKGKTNYALTSPAKFIDLHPPQAFTKHVNIPKTKDEEGVIHWSYENVTEKQFKETEKRIKKDISERIQYIETGFTQIITDLQHQIQELQRKQLLGDSKVQEKIIKKSEQIKQLVEKRKERIARLSQIGQLNAKEPEVMGCAYVIPLSQVEFQEHYGMSRDDEAEAVAMKITMDYEYSQGWIPEDVSEENAGYDIRSQNPDGLKRYIEVKGRNGGDGSVMLSENEKNRLSQLGDSAWLYIVTNCKTNPQLYRLQDPGNTLRFELKSKGIQYYLPMKTWKAENQKTEGTEYAGSEKTH